MKSDLVDLDGVLVHETPKAYLVRFDDDKEPVWLPKSAIELAMRARGRACIVTLPQRLAEEKGLA
jgi:hypothetical protein